MQHVHNTAAIGIISPDNRAWRRFRTLAGEHFHMVAWCQEDGRPVMVTLIDQGSGDAVSLAVIESVEDDEPYALLAVTADAAVTAHGPMPGGAAASACAPRLAAADPAITATGPVPLHQSHQTRLPDHVWRPLPAKVAGSAHPMQGDQTPAMVLVLLDRAGGQVAAIGPFSDPAAARAWHPTPEVDAAVDRLVVGLHPTRPGEPATAG